MFFVIICSFICLLCTPDIPHNEKPQLMCSLSECKSADLGEWEAQTENDSITASEIMNGVAQDTEGMDLAPGDILALGHIFELLETKHEGDLNSTEDAALLAEVRTGRLRAVVTCLSIGFCC